MRVLVLGATGFIGRAVSRRLADGGHDVVGLARSPDAAQRLARAGHEALPGDVCDLDEMAQIALRFDAVINAAAPAEQPTAEGALAERLAEALSDTECVLIWSSGVRVAEAPRGTIGDESSELRLDGPVGWKAQAEVTVLSAGGLRAMAVRPPFVYARTGTSVVELLRQFRQGGPAVLFPGDGEALWSTVHLDDLADLYLRVLERGTAGRAYVAASDSTITVGELAGLVSELEGLGGRAEGRPVAEMRAMMGPMADLLVTDAVFSGARARDELDWQPNGPSIRDTLVRG